MGRTKIPARSKFLERYVSKLLEGQSLQRVANGLRVFGVEVNRSTIYQAALGRVPGPHVLYAIAAHGRTDPGDFFEHIAVDLGAATDGPDLAHEPEPAPVLNDAETALVEAFRSLSASNRREALRYVQFLGADDGEDAALPPPSAIGE